MMKGGRFFGLFLFLCIRARMRMQTFTELPAPDGPIYLVMRLYWPKTTPPPILPRHVETAGGEEGQLNRAARWEGVFPLKLPLGPL
jgi:hypothetical protein